MTYSDSTGSNAQLLKRAIAGTIDFAGRSRRTEVIYYWIASTLISLVLKFVVGVISSFEDSELFGNILWFCLIIPFFALFVRRLHDQNRSGWWGLLLPISALLSFPLVLTRMRGELAAIVAQQTAPVSIAAGVCGAAVMVLCLLPGTEESNRFGPNPRLDTA